MDANELLEKAENNKEEALKKCRESVCKDMESLMLDVLERMELLYMNKEALASALAKSLAQTLIESMPDKPEFSQTVLIGKLKAYWSVLNTELTEFCY